MRIYLRVALAIGVLCFLLGVIATLEAAAVSGFSGRSPAVSVLILVLLGVASLTCLVAPAKAWNYYDRGETQTARLLAAMPFAIAIVALLTFFLLRV